MWLKSITIIIVAILILIILPINSISISSDKVVTIGALTPDSDNTFGDATPITVPGIKSGSVNETDDRFDFYNVTLNSNSTDGDLLKVNYTITDPSGLGYMAIYNPEFYPIGSGICMVGVNDFVNRTICACTPGNYYILIVGYGPETNYQFNITWQSESRTTDSDNENATANLAASGGSYNGNIDPVYDYLDLYNLTVTSGTTTTEGVIVELLYYQDKELIVYSPDGTIRERQDTIFSSDPFSKEVITFAADQTGKYRIAVAPSHGLVDDAKPSSYTLNTTIVPGIPPDNDYDWNHATLVYNGTELNLSFDSKFDQFDMFMIDLNKSENLTVSILYNDGHGDTDIWIRAETLKSPYQSIYYSPSKGTWGWSIAEETCRHYIEVECDDYIGNYTILFSLNGENLWFQDDPMIKKNINLDFSMLEDSVDVSHVNLKDVFIDPDSAIIFDSPSHPTGEGQNIDMEILINGSVTFTPHENFYGSEVFNFSATDIHLNVLYWEINVSVLPVNDAPQADLLNHQVWTQGVPVNVSFNISDVDDSEIILTDNTTLFEVNSLNQSINFTPLNDQVGFYYIQINISDGEVVINLNFSAEVLNVNDPPIITKVGDVLVEKGSNVDFNVIEENWYNYTVEAYDIDNDIGNPGNIYFKDFTSDSSFNINETTGNITFNPQQKHVGIYKVIICAYDNDGGFTYQELCYFVENVNDPPTTPVIELINISGLTVECAVTQVVDEDGDLLTYYWDFGDGTQTKLVVPTVIHNYLNGGNYTITVRVADNLGGLSIGTINVTVIEPGPDIDDIDDGIDDNMTNGDGNNSTNGINGSYYPNGSFIDTDFDKLDDNWENYFFGDLSQNPNDDYDKDGFSNYDEYINRTNPLDENSYPVEKSKDKDDTKPLSLIETLFYIFIMIIIILIIFISIFLINRRKRFKDEDKWWAQWRGQDKATINCPECNRIVAKGLIECPYCQAELPSVVSKRKYGHQEWDSSDPTDQSDSYREEEEVHPDSRSFEDQTGPYGEDEESQLESEDEYDAEYDGEYEDDQIVNDQESDWDEEYIEDPDPVEVVEQWDDEDDFEMQEPEMDWDEEIDETEFEVEDEAEAETEDEDVDWD